MQLLTSEPGDALPLFSDKANLPASLLESLVQDELPHPLIFRLTSGKFSMLIGVKEFSAQEGTVQLPGTLYEQVENYSQVEISLEPSIPKGSAIVLQLLETYEIADWKSFLEAKLTSNYTTLTEGNFLTIQDHSNFYRFKVLSTEPGPSICVVDTDIDLSIQPLNDEMAYDMLHHQEDQIVDLAPLQRVKFEPHTKYRVDCGKVVIQADLSSLGDLIVCDSPQVDLTRFASSSFEATPSEHPQVECDGLVFVVVHSWSEHLDGFIQVDHPKEVNHSKQAEESLPGSVRCSNCLQQVPEKTIILHENFCRRNNVKCSCNQIFLKQIPESHWHCCNFPGNTKESFNVHNETHHKPLECSACAREFPSLLAYGHHNATECPSRVIVCQFCHLSVSAGESTPESMLQGLTSHEFECGNKTTECYKCNKIVRQRDLKSHLAIHELARKAQVRPIKCSNENCVNTVPFRVPSHAGLCDFCFGPSFSSILDPENAKLQSRLERRYVLQLTKGCAFTTCKNIYCRTSGLFQEKLSIGEVVNYVKERLLTLIPYLPCSSHEQDNILSYCFFCVDSSSTQRKMVVDFVSEQVEYPYEWCCVALSRVSKLNSQTDYLKRLQEWLEENAVKEKQD